MNTRPHRAPLGGVLENVGIQFVSLPPTHEHARLRYNTRRMLVSSSFPSASLP
jgi:hypothetical protein